jgi:hypothetical protein
VTIARVWAYHGRETTLVPAFIAMLFATSSLAVVMASVARLRGWTIGLLSGMALLMARTYTFQTACQCADVPIGFFILVAISFMALGLQARKPAPFFAVAGLATGCARRGARARRFDSGPLVRVPEVTQSPVTRQRDERAAAARVLAIFKRLVPSNICSSCRRRRRRVEACDQGALGKCVQPDGDRVPTWGEVWGGAIASRRAVAQPLSATAPR